MFHQHKADFKRCVPGFLSNHKTLFAGFSGSLGLLPCLLRASAPALRPVAFNITEFGAVGDGVTDNTMAFERGCKGGAQLNVPAGNWLTAPFNLTSHMTLFLAEGAVILGIDVSL